MRKLLLTVRSYAPCSKRSLSNSLLLFVYACAASDCGDVRADTETPPPVAREFRAAWVATVANIDWPSRPGLSTEQQQAELVAIVDKAAELNLNALVFQVRPHCDALYSSKLEPWSEYLTGKMGQPPDPYYDPLELFVVEAHARGIELHAWFNPYRASHPAGKSELSAGHVSKTKPKIVRKYGKHHWLDPGEQKAAEHSLGVILDVVKRYDIDGIHFDDYFYPYPINDKNGKSVPFPDEASWQKRPAELQELSRSDWRRHNVDSLIQRVHDEVKRIKPWVKFGISPFGIWRPGHPESITGFDAYENLYADAKKWYQLGWVDYLTPQLYWKVDKQGQSYPVLLNWWHEQNSAQRHLWPGNFSSRVANESAGNWEVAEIVRQIKITRAQNGASGNVHFSMKALMDDRGLAEALAAEPYRQPALVPASNWLNYEPPPAPSAKVSSDKLLLKTASNRTPWLWVVQLKRDKHWLTRIVPGSNSDYSLSEFGSTSFDCIEVTTVNRAGVMGTPQKILHNGH